MVASVDIKSLENALLALSANSYPTLPSPPKVPKRASVALILRIRPTISSTTPTSQVRTSNTSISSRSEVQQTPGSATRNIPSFTFPYSDSTRTSSNGVSFSGIANPAIPQSDSDPDQTFCETTDPLYRSYTPSAPPAVSSSLSSPPRPGSIESQIQTFFSHPSIANGQTEIMFIKRTSRPTDQWGGHIAFPGGGRETADLSDEATARRETLEEVGLDITKLCNQTIEMNTLSADGKGNLPQRRSIQGCIPIGALPQRLVSSAWGRSPLLVLCPYVYLITAPFTGSNTIVGASNLSGSSTLLDPLKLQPSEVASVHWVPLQAILEPSNRRVWSYSLQGACVPRNSRRSPGHLRKQSRPRPEHSRSPTSIHVPPEDLSKSNSDNPITPIVSSSANTATSQPTHNRHPSTSVPPTLRPQSFFKTYISNPLLQFSEWSVSSLDMPAVQLVPGESVWAVPNVSFLASDRQNEHLLLWGLTLGMTSELIALVEAAVLDKKGNPDVVLNAVIETVAKNVDPVSNHITDLAKSRLLLGDTLSDNDEGAYAAGFDGIDHTDEEHTGLDLGGKTLSFYQFAHALPRATKGDVNTWMGMLDFLGFGAKDLKKGRDSRSKGKEREERKTRDKKKVTGEAVPATQLSPAELDGVSDGSWALVHPKRLLEVDVRDGKNSTGRSFLSPISTCSTPRETAPQERRRGVILQQPHVDVANVPLTPTGLYSDEGLSGSDPKGIRTPSSSPIPSQVLSQSHALRMTLSLLASAPSSKASLFSRFVNLLRKAIIAAVLTRVAVGLVTLGAVGVGLSTVVKAMVNYHRHGQTGAFIVAKNALMNQAV